MGSGGLRGALMVCGTGSDAGKTTIVAALCRLLHRAGVSVAPFKAQNMSLNSYVTESGHEISRAQAHQAFAAGIEPDATMNPVLLKPASETTCEVIIDGVSRAVVDSVGIRAHTAQLFEHVVDVAGQLRSRYDVVVVEGAGGVAEINVMHRDISNLRLASRCGIPAVIVGDIERGGVFASLYGSHELLPAGLRACVRGFLINRFRGEQSLLAAGLDELRSRTGVPMLGVVPWIDGLSIDAEDSLALASWPIRSAAGDADTLDIAVVRLPHISNFTDVDPLALEPSTSVRLVTHPRALGAPDLVVLPGTKATVDDLAWLRRQGFDEAIAAGGATVLGICGGYQMLGREITDGVESSEARVDGLGWLDAQTRFEREKVTRRRAGQALGHPVTGYQIHRGRVTGSNAWLELNDEPEGASADADGARGPIYGTTVHGLFESDAFRRAFLAEVAARRGRSFVAGNVSFADARDAQVDRVADIVGESLDMTAIEELISSAARS